MRHASLFSGIGGFDLAAQWMGWENVFHCEWNGFGRKILNYYWPDSVSYGDITKTDFTSHRGTIDILTGGFPCQPYSSAGKRKGKADERHLWPEMLRAIREIQPSWVVGENVRGLINWNGGMVFDEVQAELEAQGYEVTPFLLPACAVNAPHRRDRIWFIAYSVDNHRRTAQSNRNEAREFVFCKPSGLGLFRTFANSGSARLKRNKEFTKGCYSQRDGVSFNVINSFHGRGITTNPGGADGRDIRRQKSREQEKQKYSDFGLRSRWENFPTQSPICNGNDGIPTNLDGITFSKWRVESIKGGGNAIVPQVALQILKAIEATNLKSGNGEDRTESL